MKRPIKKKKTAGISPTGIRFQRLGAKSLFLERTTTVSAAWDWKHLYFQFRCQSPDVKPLYTERDSPLFREECVEIFLRVTGREDYWEFQGNSGSVIYDAHVPRFAANRLWPRWSGWKAKRTKFRALILQGKYWQASWAISWRDLEIEPVAGMTLQIRLCRVADDPFLAKPELSSWPAAKRCFDEPGTWGTLKLLDAVTGQIELKA